VCLFAGSSRCVMKWKLLTINQKFVLLLFNCVLLVNLPSLVDCDVFKLGYITGSHRRHGDLEYERPGMLSIKLLMILVSNDFFEFEIRKIAAH
jgi:hypothetical protein